MLIENILNDDWTDYDDIKKRNNSDPRTFIPEQRWEANYLVNKIAKHCPDLDIDDIKAALFSYSKYATNARRREDAIKWILKRMEVNA